MSALKLKTVSVDFSSLIRGIGLGILLGVYMTRSQVNWIVSFWLGFVVILVGHCIRYRKDKQDGVGNRDGFS